MNSSLKGIPASPGIVEGRVRIVREREHHAEFREGEILVTIMTEPSMAAMMNKASAIITDTGGLTCHAAIVSRELGIPCVVATKEATIILKDGMHIRVDGKEGTVTTLDAV